MAETYMLRDFNVSPCQDFRSTSVIWPCFDQIGIFSIHLRWFIYCIYYKDNFTKLDKFKNYLMTINQISENVIRFT